MPTRKKGIADGGGNRKPKIQIPIKNISMNIHCLVSGVNVSLFFRSMQRMKNHAAHLENGGGESNRYPKPLTFLM